jgi:hypothetical protein
MRLHLEKLQSRSTGGRWSEASPPVEVFLVRIVIRPRDISGAGQIGQHTVNYVCAAPESVLRYQTMRASMAM